MKNSLRLLLGSLLIGASMLPARAMEAPAAPDAAGQVEPSAEAVAPPAPEAHGADAPDAGSPAAEHAPETPALAEGHNTHWTESRTPMPFDVMRSVQFLQDQVARGNVRAIRVQALLLRRFARTFIEAAPEVWNDPRNTRAVVLFTFSGGTPEVISTLLDQGRLPESERALFEGALAYVRNDLPTAAKKLESVTIDDLEPVLAAQVSLALGQIHQIDHPDQAIEDLANARLLAPGTLIEEAALRLGAPLADAAGAHDDADRMARRYFDTYHDSSYAANFETRYVALVVGRAVPDAQGALISMDAVVAGLPDDRQQRLYLAAARRSLVAGSLPFASQVAERAIVLGGLEPGDASRATLYRTASSLGTDSQDASRKALDGIDRNLLHIEDQKILDAAYSVLDSMARPALMTEVSNPGPVEPETSAVLARAKAALDAASHEMKKP